MTKNDDIKVGDEVTTKAYCFWYDQYMSKCLVISIEKRLFVKRYVVITNGRAYKKYRWQLFKINN